MVILNIHCKNKFKVASFCHNNRSPIIGSTIFVLLIYVSCAFAQRIYVPVYHSVYEFLDRMETKGVCQNVLANTKPLTRTEIGQYLDEIIIQKLSHVEKEQLNYFLFEFRDSTGGNKSSVPNQYLEKLTNHKLVGPWLPDIIYQNNRNMFSYENENLKLFWDPVISRRILLTDQDTKSSTSNLVSATNGFQLWGAVSKSIGFFVNIRDTKESGASSYPTRKNYTREGMGFVRGGGNHEYHDETVAYISLSKKFFTFQFGKDSNVWGPGYRGQLSMSNFATSYDFLKLQFNHPNVKFVSFVGFLKNYDADYFYDLPQEKQIAAHRLEFSLFKKLDIGLSETVIFSGRKYEPAYYNPVMFYRSAEHYLGDRDNATMSLDFELKIIPKTKVYGELFLDDVTTSKLGTGYYGNKYAYTAGLYNVDILGCPNLDLRFEYTRIRPYVYSHKNDLNSYRHFISTLGHWAGPNAENLFIQLEYRLDRRFKIYGFYEKTRHGANNDMLNVGGNMFSPHATLTDPENVDLLDGNLEMLKKMSFGIKYGPLPQLFISALYSYLEGDVKLINSFQRSDIGKGHLFQLQLSYKY